MGVVMIGKIRGSEGFLEASVASFVYLISKGVFRGGSVLVHQANTNVTNTPLKLALKVTGYALCVLGGCAATLASGLIMVGIHDWGIDFGPQLEAISTMTGLVALVLLLRDL